MPTIKVMHFGLGPIGAAIAKQVAMRQGFKIVGAIDIDPAKVGRDVGDVVGLSKRVGAKVSDQPSRALKAAKPDVVVLCTSSSIKTVLPQIETILKAKVPIVSTTEELSYPSYTHIRQARLIHAMAKKAKVAVLGTGVNPALRWTPADRAQPRANGSTGSCAARPGRTHPAFAVPAEDRRGAHD